MTSMQEDPPHAEPVSAPQILVLSTSLHPNSRSRLLATHARGELESLGAVVQWFDCRDVPMPYMDGHSAGAHETTVRLKAALSAADGVVIASGVYNFDTSAVSKACLELGGRSWNDQVVSIMCAAGSTVSYMAPMGLANSLMMDFRCLIVPWFPMVTDASFKDGVLTDAECARRVRSACQAMVALTGMRVRA